MSEQYAFGIAFDAREGGGHPHSGDAEAWQTLCLMIEAAIAAAGHPIAERDRWEEYGMGHIFWGSRAECEAVKHILQQFDVAIQEERNLEPGYYTTETATYYVSEAGDILGLVTEAGNGRVRPLPSIPMEAYHVKGLAPEVTAKFWEASRREQKAAQKEGDTALQPEAEVTRGPKDVWRVVEVEQVRIEQQSPEEPAMAAFPIDRQQHEALKRQTEGQAQRIAELEQMLYRAQQVERQSAASALEGSTDYETLQQQVTAQSAEIVELKQQVESLTQQLRESKAVVAAKVEAVEHEALQRQAASQVTRIAELEYQLQKAERQAAEWQARAEARVERAEYEALQHQLRDFAARRRRGWWSRLMGWFSSNRR